jgi:hypothetical protein
VQVKESVSVRLAQHGLSKYVQIIHTPVLERGEYDLDTNTIERPLDSGRVDWLLIDGPSGPGGCRESTLPFLARFCRPGARWFLDDAFRDRELQALQEWSHRPGILVEGIYPVGKGLGTGIVFDPQRVVFT